MSASREKKSRTSNPEGVVINNRTRKAQEAEAKKQKMYTFWGVLALAGALAAVVWNNTYDQRVAPAFTIGDTAYNAAQVQMFYTNEMYGALTGTHSPGTGGVPYDYSAPADEQSYDGVSTWHQFFIDCAITSIAEIHLLNQAAIADGYQLSAEAQAEIETTRADLDLAWLGQAQNLESFLRMQYGTLMTEDAYFSLMEKEAMANDYQAHKYDSFETPAADLDAYYEENKDLMDIITLSQVTFSLEMTPTYDEEGTQVEFTDEEYATFEAEVDIVAETSEALSQELEADLAGGGSLADWMETYDGDGDVTLETSTLSSSFSTENDQGAWVLSSDRTKGDVYYSGEGDGSSASYSILVFEDRAKAEETTANIRHILIGAAESGVVPTEEEFATAEAEAQALLDQWAADGSTPEGFGLLAQEHSADSGSAAVGGVMENVSTFSGYIEDFANWSTDPERKPGDTGLVKNTGSSTQGWHIMYFEEWSSPMWELTAEGSLLADKMDAWREELFADIATQIVPDAGTDLVVPVSLF